jgi:hypothetical protein
MFDSIFGSTQDKIIKFEAPKWSLLRPEYSTLTRSQLENRLITYEKKNKANIIKIKKLELDAIMETIVNNK